MVGAAEARAVRVMTLAKAGADDRWWRPGVAVGAAEVGAATGTGTGGGGAVAQQRD